MQQPKIAQKLVVFLGIALSVAACSSSDGGSGTGGSGGITTDGSAGNAGTGGTGGDCTVSCDDGFSCTIDTCNGSKCTHSIGPNSGATACPTGQYCTVDKGCIASPACVNFMDCQKAFSGDACKSNIKCDPASSVCVFDTLDKDGDGHPPQVCGGGDCDDSKPDVHPGAHEICDGKDNDCDGTVDNGASCSKTGAVCVSGQCTCPTGMKDCSSAGCVNTANDPQNCGGCDISCGGGTCENGQCKCESGYSDCHVSCSAINNSNCNCHTCPSGSTCDPSLGGGYGLCVGCPATDQCNGDCVDKMSDKKNCGACGKECPYGVVCKQGSCDCSGMGQNYAVCSCDYGTPTCTPHCCPAGPNCNADGTCK